MSMRPAIPFTVADSPSTTRRHGQRCTPLRAPLLLILLLMLVLVGTCLPSAPARAATAPDDPRARLEQVDSQLEQLEQWLAAKRIDRDALAGQLRDSDLAVARLAAATRDAQQAVDDSQQKIDAIGADIEHLVALEASQRKALLEQLRSAWLLTRRDPLQLILEAESPDRLGRLLEFHRMLTEARVQALDQWKQSRADLATRRDSLAAEQKTLIARHDELAARTDRLDAARRDRARVLAELDQRIARREDARADLQRDRQRLSELLERLSREAERPTGTAFARSRGKLPWPVAPHILQAFGSTRGPGLPAADGVMLGAPSGTRIQAVAPGRVVFADWMRGFGLMIIIDHGGGFMSLYAQAESLLRADGDLVEAGEPIATAGQSGGSTRPGVWFEIRRSGAPEDPVSWCVAKRG